MKAVILEKFDSPLKVKQIAKPVAKKDQVLVKIKASGLNPLDLKIKAGQAAHAQVTLPAVPGIDMAGIVESTGRGVTTFKPGDEVYGMTGGVGGIQGTLAEYAAVDQDLLALKPANLSFREAAALPLIFITAWEGLVDRAKTGAGHTVLIQGGAGGVGHIATQLAVAQRATVFATVAPGQFELMEKYGAIPIDYTKAKPEQYVRQFTEDQGFDIIFDTVGGVTLDHSFKAARQYTGHVISILGWGTHSLAPLSFHGATYSGVFTLYPLITGKCREHHGDILRQAAQLIEAGKMLPILDPAIYGLEKINDAYAALENGQASGKIVIDIS